MELKIGLILSCISFLLFIVYNAIAIGVLGIPWSMSETFYLYEKKKKGLGWLFTIYMWLMGSTMIPSWVDIGDSLNPWMCYLTFLAFISGACILFVGTAPRYKEDMEGKVHTIAAIICAVCALIWDFVACWEIWWVPICGMVVPAIIATCTKTWKSSREYWLEMMTREEVQKNCKQGWWINNNTKVVDAIINRINKCGGINSVIQENNQKK